MTREIEFRGRLKSDGSWVYGDLIHDNHGGCYIYPIESMCLSLENKVDANTVGQFTGLRDKNGVKIFEGDIVEVISIMCGYKVSIKRMLCEIVYDNDLCCFNFLASDRERCMCVTIPDAEIKVIGNIHDNPELSDNKG